MEGDAGASQLNLADQQDPHTTEPQAEAVTEITDPISATDAEEAAARPSRLGRGWMAAILAGLLVLAGAAGVGGYLALRAHQDSERIASDEAEALQAAKDCVTATQAPNTQAMIEAQTKIIECATGDFGAQAGLYSGMLLDAYQAANVQVKVSDLRAAVEKHNDDGSMDLLVAVRVLVTNSEKSDEEQGYRLRVKMARAEDGNYQVARLDQVTSS
jgi:Mce-associated membrane protein